jgi:hypothetical protein
MKRSSPSAGAAPIVLQLGRYFEPKIPSDLTPLQQKQLVAAGKLYHGETASVEALMDEETGGEGSFAGCLEVREIVDEAGNPAYTSFFYMGDSGTVFEAGGTKVVAEIIQCGLECDNATLEGPLDQVLKVKPAKKVAAKKA